MMTPNAILELYKAGNYGTFDQPNRSGSIKSVFWTVALGYRKAREYRNCVTYPAALAGALAKAQHDYAIKHELGHDEQRSKDEWVKAGYSLKDYRNRKNRLLREQTAQQIFQDLIAPTTED